MNIVEQVIHNITIAESFSFLTYVAVFAAVILPVIFSWLVEEASKDQPVDDRAWMLQIMRMPIRFQCVGDWFLGILFWIFVGCFNWFASMVVIIYTFISAWIIVAIVWVCLKEHWNTRFTLLDLIKIITSIRRRRK